MLIIESVLAALGLSKAAVLPGLMGGAISGGIMPGVLAVFQALWKRILTGAICGAIVAGYAAVPLAGALERPTYLQGIALGLGLFGLSFVFKLLKAWNDFELGGALNTIVQRLLDWKFK